MTVSNPIATDSKPNAFAKTCQAGGKVCGVAVDAAAFIVTDTQALEKGMKIVSKTLEIVGILRDSALSTTSVIVSNLKEVITFVETISFFALLKKFVRRDEKTGNYLMKDKNVSWQSKAALTSLLAHTTLKLLYAAQRWKLMELAIAAKHTIGQLPAFKLITDGLYGLYNVFGAWDNMRTLVNCYKAGKLVDKKIEKWEKRAQTVEQIRNGDSTEFAALRQRYAAKIIGSCVQFDDFNGKLKKFEEDPKLLNLKEEKRDALRKELNQEAEVVAKKMAKLPILQKRLELLATGKHKILADELAVKNTELKTRKWKEEKFKIGVNRNRSILGFLSALGKAATVALALIFVALNFWIAPTLLTVIGLSLFADTMGMTRIFYDKYPPKYKEPKPVTV